MAHANEMSFDSFLFRSGHFLHVSFLTNDCFSFIAFVQLCLFFLVFSPPRPVEFPFLKFEKEKTKKKKEKTTMLWNWL